MAHTQTALTIQEWVATSLEFTMHKSDIVWAKPLLQRIVSEVPHATRNKVSDFIKAQGAYLKPKHSSASGKCETAFWGVRYHTVPLNSDASQATQHHSTSEVAPPPTLVEWFAKTIEVTHNLDDYVGRMFAINAAMVAVPDISEVTVIKYLQSKGLRPEGTSGGKMAQKRVFIGGRPKTAKEQSTEVSAPQAEDSDVHAHMEDTRAGFFITVLAHFRPSMS